MRHWFALLILVILAVGVYLLIKGLANFEQGISNITNAPGNALNAVGSELSSLWAFVTGGNTTANADLDPNQQSNDLYNPAPATVGNYVPTGASTDPGAAFDYSNYITQ